MHKREVYSSFEWRPRKRIDNKWLKKEKPICRKKELLSFSANRYDKNQFFLRADLTPILPPFVTRFQWVATCKMTEINEDEKDDDIVMAGQHFTVRGQAAWTEGGQRFVSRTHDKDGIQERRYQYHDLMSDVELGKTDEKDPAMLQWEVGPVQYLEKQVCLRLVITLNYEQEGTMVRRRFLDHRFETAMVYMSELIPISKIKLDEPVRIKEEKTTEKTTSAVSSISIPVPISSGVAVATATAATAAAAAVSSVSVPAIPHDVEMSSSFSSSCHVQ